MTVLRATDTMTVTEAFRETVSQRRDHVAIRDSAGEISWTWGEVAEKVDAVARGLYGLGVRRQDRVAILLGNRPEFHVVDLAVATLGAAPFSIYLTSSPEQIAYVLNDTAAQVIVTDAERLARVADARDASPGLAHIVTVDGAEREGALTLEDLISAGAAHKAGVIAVDVEPDDLLTLIYTSGTTGPPKGVEVTHRNVIATLSGIEQLIPLPEGGRVISWLPNAHIAERVSHHYLPVLLGLEVTCCPDPRRIIEVLPTVRPCWFFAVPRIWEKLKIGLEARFAAADGQARAQLEAGIAAAVEKVRLEQAGDDVPSALAEQVAAVDAAVFSGLREQLGLDEAVAVNVGAAPTPIDVLEFFHAIGIPVAEVWGMSETCGAATTNPPGRIKLGTVGPPSPGYAVRLAEDGEVLVRGAAVTRGYRGMADATAAAFDEEGWLRTGDVGELDEDGYLRIIDRKKDLIINSAGKNMSPAHIEATLKSASSLIGHAVCIGDARPYNTALLALDPEVVAAWAEGHGLADAAIETVVEDQHLVDEIEAAVARANARLARVEQIKRYTILPAVWLPGGDELTPTMKIRRKPIADRYADEIAALYA